ncbi:ARM REPEAT SUPERFAMILY PROTEIN [Salix koriyanagi]|uniref:ARM REPEAT SUPERFAMILY PROTEIN n=1 Tax=Salix koriyanagi TaxID=2511006 RepID=A0A9Q0PVI2_9ROSI|nr:ARM REPEAT SUPERFAMILY PROTEIN [Salix koriyanagi]
MECVALRFLLASGKLKSDLLSKPEQENSDDSSAGADDDLDRGFSSLDGMLQWAIVKLKEGAEDAQWLPASELQKRQLEIKELLILVEPLDNANDLNKLGGLAIVIQELNHPDPGTRRLSAWVLGKACQNNPVAQKQILELGALTKLIKMELFYAEAGDAMLQEILSNSNSDIRLCRKAVFLVADLISWKRPLLQSRIYLLQLKTTEALIFKDFCDLNGSLERMRQQLLDLMASEDHRDYAVDLETLRREVELLFHEKLGKVENIASLISGYNSMHSYLARRN